MATQKSKRKKRRNPETAPRAVPSHRREQRSTRQAAPATPTTPQRRARNPVGTYGDRPEGPFGGLPISEIAIFAGAVGLIVGIIQHGGPALIAGIAVCTLGVLEITGREHFSGYRSHTILLAAMPAVAAEIAFVAIFGEPSPRLLLLAVIVPIYAVLFWLLRIAFMRARQARLARPPAP